MEQTRFAQNPKLQATTTKAASNGGLRRVLYYFGMTNALVEYWRAFEPTTQDLNIHPEDHSWIERSYPGIADKRRLRTHADYVSSDSFGENRGLHLSLLPLPYIGNLEQSDIIIFLLNPGFSKGDYYLEDHDEFRELAHRNLRQERIEDYPFIYLNPTFAWSPGFIWWEAKFRPIIKALQEDKHLSYRECLQKISHRVAAVELFPYHSVDEKSLAKGWHEIQSVRKATNFLTSIANKSDVLKLVVRSQKLWLGNNAGQRPDHFPVVPAARNFTFKHDLVGNAGGAGALLLQKLRSRTRS